MSVYTGSHSGLDRSVLIDVEQIGKTDKKSAYHIYGRTTNKQTNKHLRNMNKIEIKVFGSRVAMQTVELSMTELYDTWVLKNV